MNSHAFEYWRALGLLLLVPEDFLIALWGCIQYSYCFLGLYTVYILAEHVYCARPFVLFIFVYFALLRQCYNPLIVVHIEV